MATKSYTSLEQSKKLAEMLPVESADMHYATWTILDGEFIVSPNQGSTIESLQEDFGNQIIPCWSLAALLNYLKSKNKFPEIKELSDGRFKLTTFIWDGKNSIQFSIADNLVDACYEMILKLHELNLL